MVEFISKICDKCGAEHSVATPGVTGPFTHWPCVRCAHENPFFKPDPVAHPQHYNQGKIEVIEFLEDQKLGFHLGNAVKYISRAGKKDGLKTVEDLEKAVWYLKRHIECLKAEGEQREKIRPNDMVEK